jgi:hypothetical protein
MGDIITGRTWIDGAVVTPGKLNEYFDDSEIADGAVTTAKIADANVTTAKIADGAVTESKVEPGAFFINAIIFG